MCREKIEKQKTLPLPSSCYYLTQLTTKSILRSVFKGMRFKSVSQTK